MPIRFKEVRGVTIPYFDPEPKKLRKDFFDMDTELSKFKEALRACKLVVVTGLRRYSKTSLILTGLNELGLDYVFLDCRLLPRPVIIGSILKLLANESSRKSWVSKVLSGIEGVSIGPFGVSFKRADYGTLIDVISALSSKVLVLDEAQELRFFRYRLDPLLAYIYDHTDVKVVVSRSQVGVLYRSLRA